MSQSSNGKWKDWIWSDQDFDNILNVLWRGKSNGPSNLGHDKQLKGYNCS